MKKYKVILTESEMRKLRNLIDEKATDADVDVFSKDPDSNFENAEKYLKTMIVDILKLDYKFDAKIERNDSEIVVYKKNTDKIIFIINFFDITDIRLLSCMFNKSTEDAERFNFIKKYDIFNYDDRGRNGIETLAKLISTDLYKYYKKMYKYNFVDNDFIEDLENNGTR